MADNEQADGAADEGAAAKKGKLKLVIAAVGFIAILGGGAGWFFFMRGGHGEEVHAEAPPPKPPSFVEVPDMMVNLVGAPGERVQYLRVKIVLDRLTPCLPEPFRGSRRCCRSSWYRALHPKPACPCLAVRS